MTCSWNEPLLDPRVDVFLQGRRDAGLDGSLRPVLNAVDDSWEESGCHPTCLLMIVRWWAELNQHTQGQIALGPPGIAARLGSHPNAHIHLRPFTRHGNRMTGGTIASDLWRAWGPPAAHPTASAPTGVIAPYRPLLPRLTAATPPGQRLPTYRYASATKWEVDHGFIQRSMRQVIYSYTPTSGPNAGQPFYENLRTSTEYFGARATLETKRAAIQAALWRGPIVANMTSPAHNVVIYGYFGGRIYIADPGLVIRNHWMPHASAQGARAVADPSGYVELPEVAEFTLRSGSSHPLRWLDSVNYIEWYRFATAVVDTRTP